uniref:Uncharacterized protein n=1 Tax=Nelumbo nucifera TaxID=4432 RepID=A0A822ZE59_NELNU|nr:TPA_asm: hypothetical protein HUJ06_015619 [Nelumbo nucifera]
MSLDTWHGFEEVIVSGIFSQCQLSGHSILVRLPLHGREHSTVPGIRMHPEKRIIY